MDEKTYELDQQVVGPTLKLAARLAEVLDGTDVEVETPYGLFYVSKVELSYQHYGDHSVVGYLVPDEGDGKTFDFYTAREKTNDD